MDHTRYVEVPADRLIRTLEDVGKKTTEVGGSFAWEIQGKERVFELYPVGEAVIERFPHAYIKVYTTLACGDLSARDCGKDAVRIIVGTQVGDKFKALRAPVKMLRTAPKDDTDRVGSFLSRLLQALRDAYKFAATVPSCALCGNAMALREGKFNRFYGCSDYPNCKFTFNPPAKG